MRTEPVAAEVVVAGAGALGSVYGGVLANAGVDVVLLAHGRHEAALRQGELNVRLPERTLAVPVRVATRAQGRIVILTAKSGRTGGALDRLAGPPQLAVSFQNGPAKNDELIRRFGSARVAGAVSMIAAELAGPGLVSSATVGVTYLGHERETQRPGVAELAAALSAAGLQSRLTDDPSSVEWSKLAYTAPLMAVQALSGRYVHDLLAAADAVHLISGVAAEIAAVARASGVEIRDWPGLFPVRTLLDAPPEEAHALLGRTAETLRAAGAVAYRTSMLQDLQAGRSTELEAIHGELVRRADLLGVRVPMLASSYRLCRLVSADASRRSAE